MTSLEETAVLSGGVHEPEAWCAAYVQLGLLPIVDPPDAVVRTTDELAVVELPADLAELAMSGLVTMMDTGPVLRQKTETLDRWLFFTDPTGTSRSAAYIALAQMGGVLFEHWTRIVLPSSATGDGCTWKIKPRRPVRGGGKPGCALPRLWTVARAARKAQVAQR
jgi:hypothetical protein